jgi:hypothetical protein
MNISFSQPRPRLEFHSARLIGMDSKQQKEQFSNAFLHAIAAVSECSISKPSVDDDSIDWTLSKVMPRRPKLDLQLKCTGQAKKEIESTIPFSLKTKNYDDLRVTDLLCPRILVVVFVPDNVGDWLTSDLESLTLRRCAHWMTLFGFSDSLNDTSETVYLPTDQKFDVDALNAIMQRISDGGQP